MVLDLDETLVHGAENNESFDFEISLPISESYTMVVSSANADSLLDWNKCKAASQTFP